MRRQPGRLIFVDETSVKTNMCRLRGRALCGERLKADAPFGKWHTQTFIAGLRCDSLVAPWVVNGAMDGEAFAAYIETQLAPTLEPGDVVILDNLNTHKSQRAADALAARGAWFVRRFRLTPAEIFARPQPDRNGIFEAEGASAKSSRPNLRSPLAGDRRHLQPLPRRRVLELLQSTKLCRRLNARGSRMFRMAGYAFG